MRTENKTEARGHGEYRSSEAEITARGNDFEPRKLTLTENVILTIKVLAGAGVLIAALWGINLWTSAR